MFKVIAACADERSGKRYGPGDIFDPSPDTEQAKRLQRAGCIAEGDDDRAVEDMTDAALIDELIRVGRAELAKLSREALLDAVTAARRRAAGDGDDEGGDALDKMTVAELRKHAEDNAIELAPDVTKKADIVAAILQASGKGG